MHSRTYAVDSTLNRRQLPLSKQPDFTEPARSDNSRKLKELKEDIRRSQRNVQEGFRTADELVTQVYNDLAQAITEDFPMVQVSSAQRDDSVHQGFATSRARVCACLPRPPPTTNGCATCSRT